MIHRPTPTAQTWRVSVLAVILALLVGPLLALGPTAPAAAQAERCFPETGFCVRGRFLDRWTNNGGLAINGYPITAERTETLEDGKQYTVQWFERVRMELHPENPPPNDVLLGQFGRLLHPADPPVAAKPGMTFFPETGHNIPPDFAAYYAANGGLSQFGYPLSEVFAERLDDGKTYEVQYTERARFERHPENAAPYNVLLGQFGRCILNKTCGGPPPAPPAPPVTTIFQDDFSSPASGWPQQQFPSGSSIGYVNGIYRIIIGGPESGASASNPRLNNLTDTSVEVDATKIAGEEDTHLFGVVCRYQDRDNFYALVISNLGAYGIVKVKGGRVAGGGIVGDSASPVRRGNNATNRIRADCVGRTLALYVNGQKVLETQDADFTSGRVWLQVLSGEKSGVAVDFDNFVARKPAAGTPSPAPVAGDEQLVGAALDLIRGVPEMRYITDNLAARKVNWRFGGLPAGAWGSYSLRQNLISYAPELRTMDPHDLAAVAGHEGQHAYDLWTFGPPRTTDECYALEYRGFLASAALWRAWYGDRGKPNPVNDFEREENAILADILTNNGDRLKQFLVEAYAEQCAARVQTYGIAPPDARGIPMSTEGLPELVARFFPDAEAQLASLAGRTFGTAEPLPLTTR